MATGVSRALVHLCVLHTLVSTEDLDCRADEEQ